MKYIKIIRGTYGHRNEGSRITIPMGRTDPAFEVPNDVAKDLVKRKIAAYADPPKEKPAPSEPVGNIPDYNVKTNANILIALLKDIGITATVGKKKPELVAMLDDYYGVSKATIEDEDEDAEDDEDDIDDDEGGGGEDDEALPKLGAEDPVT